MELNQRVSQLWADLQTLHSALRERTFRKYGRINPFIEDLFEWTERGEYWAGKDSRVTVYQSTTINGDVTIGAESWIGPHCSLDGGGGLAIGENCSISAGVHIVTHDTVRWALSGGRVSAEYARVSIGRNTFIGCNAVVTKGATIGECCVIGAGSVVTRSVPAYSIVAGVPARVIGRVQIDEHANVRLSYDQPN